MSKDGLGEWKGYINELKNKFGKLDELKDE